MITFIRFDIASSITGEDFLLAYSALLDLDDSIHELAWLLHQVEVRTTTLLADSLAVNNLPFSTISWLELVADVFKNRSYLRLVKVELNLKLHVCAR